MLHAQQVIAPSVRIFTHPQYKCPDDVQRRRRAFLFGTFPMEGKTPVLVVAVTKGSDLV
jgi:hypothetical protein